MDKSELLFQWLYFKEYSKELLNLAKQNQMYLNHNSLLRVWRIESDDIDSIINLDEFNKTLTPDDLKVLRSGKELTLSKTSLDCLFELKIKYYTHPKARSHSKSINGCHSFINTHAEQKSFKSLPFFITEIEFAEGVDLASLGTILNAKEKTIQEFNQMEEILSDYDYQKNKFKIIKYPSIQIWYQNGELHFAHK